MRPLLIGLILAAAILGCNGEASPNAPDGQAPVIVAFGDSLTAGPGLKPEQAYPSLLQQRVAAAGHNHRVVNAGLNGDTSGDALRRFDAALLPGTQIVVLAIGINDGLRGVPVATVERNVAAMIERAQARGIRVLLCAMEAPPVGGLTYTIEFHRLFNRLAQRYSLPLVPFFLVGIVGNDELNLDDTLHPNAAGHRIIADAIWPHLRPML
ncbi:MAG: arylesterase [Acidobacteria bacterium]|nr:MAG: arylesterase [Acidobacteriota bacterium]